MATERVTKKDALALAIVHEVGGVTPEQIVASHPDIKAGAAAEIVRRAEKAVRVMVDRRLHAAATDAADAPVAA